MRILALVETMQKTIMSIDVTMIRMIGNVFIYTFKYFTQCVKINTPTNR